MELSTLGHLRQAMSTLFGVDVTLDKGYYNESGWHDEEMWTAHVGYSCSQHSDPATALRAALVLYCQTQNSSNIHLLEIAS